MRIGVWMIEGNDFAKRTMLGKPCMEHVKGILAKMKNVVQVQMNGIFFEDSDVLLILSADAPILKPCTMNAFCEASTTTANVLLMEDMKTPLAIAMPSELAKTLSTQADMQGMQDILGALDDCKASPGVWYDAHTATYLRVQNAKTYAQVLKEMSAEKIETLMEAGVIFLDPDRTVVESDVIIGEGTIVYAGNLLQGKTLIGKNCELLPNNRMKNAIVGDETTLESSVLLDCKVGSHTTVGPYAYVRPKSDIGDGCRIGDFVEIKNSRIDDGTKVSHLTYVGDSDLGKGINLGCGVVFVNYDGKTKNRSTVDDHAFIGCNCNLVAPVHVGENAYIAAGSTVVEDVPSDAMMVARSRAVIKEEWVINRKKKGQL